MRRPEPTQLHELSKTIEHLAATLLGANARSIELGAHPPVAVADAELALWRWAHTLRQTGQPPSRPAHHLVSIVFLTDVDDPELDLHALVTTMTHATVQSGTIPVTNATGARTVRRINWRVRHVTAYPLATWRPDTHQGDSPTGDTTSGRAAQ